MIIRNAALADAAALADLLNEIIAIGGTTAHETPFTADSFDTNYLTGDDFICCLIALDGTGQALGFQALGRHPNHPSDWGDIGTFVSPQARGTGAGAALFAATKAAAIGAGCKVLNATIRADNLLGLAFYTRIGFQDYATEPDYTLKNGQRVGRVSKRFDLG